MFDYIKDLSMSETSSEPPIVIPTDNHIANKALYSVAISSQLVSSCRDALNSLYDMLNVNFVWVPHHRWDLLLGIPLSPSLALTSDSEGLSHERSDSPTKKTR